MSASGASFSFRGVDFAGYGVYVVGRKWPRLPEPRVNEASFSQRDGGVTQGASFERRRIVLECALVASNASARETAVESMIAALAESQTEGPGDLVVDYPNASRVWTNARLVGGIDAELARQGEFFGLEWTADPWPRAAAESELDEALIDGVASELTPEGTLLVPAIYIVQCLTGGEGVAIGNAATGETAIYANPVSVGDWVRLNTLTRTWSVSTDDGETWTTVTANTSGVPPWIVGGVANAITVTGVDCELVVTYLAGWRS